MQELIQRKSSRVTGGFGKAAFVTPTERERVLAQSPPGNIALLTGVYRPQGSVLDLRYAGFFDIDMPGISKAEGKKFALRAAEQRLTLKQACDESEAFASALQLTRDIMGVLKERLSVASFAFFSGQRGFRVLVDPHSRLFAWVQPETKFGAAVLRDVLSPILGTDIVRELDASIYNPTCGVKHDLVPHYATGLFVQPVQDESSADATTFFASKEENVDLSARIRAYWSRVAEFAKDVRPDVKLLDCAPVGARVRRGQREPLYAMPVSQERANATHFTLKGQFTSYRQVEDEAKLWASIAAHVTAGHRHLSNEMTTPRRPLYLELDGFPIDLESDQYAVLIDFTKRMLTDLQVAETRVTECDVIVATRGTGAGESGRYYHVVFRDLVVDGPRVHSQLLELFARGLPPEARTSVDRNVHKLRMVTADKWDARAREFAGKRYRVVAKLHVDAGSHEPEAVRVDTDDTRIENASGEMIRTWLELMTVRRRNDAVAIVWTDEVTSVDVRVAEGGGGQGESVRVDLPESTLGALRQHLWHEASGFSEDSRITRVTRLLSPCAEPGGRVDEPFCLLKAPSLDRVMIVSTNEHFCARASRDHDNATQYFVIHDSTSIPVGLRCWSCDHSDGKRSERHGMPPLPRGMLADLFGDLNIGPNRRLRLPGGEDAIHAMNERLRQHMFVAINEQYALLPNRGRVGIIDTVTTGPDGNWLLRIWEDREFCKWARHSTIVNELVIVDDKKKKRGKKDDDNNDGEEDMDEVGGDDVLVEIRPRSVAKDWVESDRARRYDALSNFPYMTEEPPHVTDEAALEDRFLNLWRGPSVHARRRASGEGIESTAFYRLVDVAIAHGRPEVREYVLDLIAHLFQKPWELPEVTLVLFGPQGLGKTLFTKLFKALLGKAFLAPSDHGILTGQFNAAIAGKLVIVPEEAFFAGDRSVAGKIKQLITDPEVVINAKFKEPTTVRNCARLFIVTNDEWAARLDQDDRRFCVLRVHREDMQSPEFYAQVAAEYKDKAALAALLYDFLQRPIDNFDPRKFPSPIAVERLEQKVHSLDIVAQFVLSCLRNRQLPHACAGGLMWKWGDWYDDEDVCVPKANVRDAFNNYFRTRGHARMSRPSDSKFGADLDKLCGAKSRDSRKRSRDRDAGDHSRRSYVFPCLPDARNSFEERLGVKTDDEREWLWGWPDEEEEECGVEESDVEDDVGGESIVFNEADIDL